MGGILSSPSIPEPLPQENSRIEQEQARLEKENEKLEQRNQARIRNLRGRSTGRSLLLFDDELGVTTSTHYNSPEPRKRFKDYLGG